MKIKVTLRVVHGEATGLSVNYYEWLAGDKFNCRCEVANRPAAVVVSRFLPPSSERVPAQAVLAYDEAIDLPIAEARRAALELHLNTTSIVD